MTTLTIPTTPAVDAGTRREVAGAVSSAHRRELRLAAAVQAAWLRGVQGAR